MFLKKAIIRLKQKIVCIVFGYENKHVYPIYLLKEKFENHMELLIGNEDKSHYVYIKDLYWFMYKKNKV